MGTPVDEATIKRAAESALRSQARRVLIQRLCVFVGLVIVCGGIIWWWDSAVSERVARDDALRDARQEVRREADRQMGLAQRAKRNAN